MISLARIMGRCKDAGTSITDARRLPDGLPEPVADGLQKPMLSRLLAWPAVDPQSLRQHQLRVEADLVERCVALNMLPKASLIDIPPPMALVDLTPTHVGADPEWTVSGTGTLCDAVFPPGAVGALLAVQVDPVDGRRCSWVSVYRAASCRAKFNVYHLYLAGGIGFLEEPLIIVGGGNGKNGEYVPGERVRVEARVGDGVGPARLALVGIVAEKAGVTVA